MVRDITLGQYMPGMSKIHRLDARAKILFLIAYIVFIFVAKNYMSLMLITMASLLVVLMTRVKFSMYLKSMKVILFVVVLTGIFQDSSVFGMYTAYLDYEAFRKALGFAAYDTPELSYKMIDKVCVYYPGGAPSKNELLRVYSELQKRFDMFPFSFDKCDWQNYETPEEKRVFAMIPLAANVSDLQKLSNALRAIVALVVVMLVAIISVGISSAFRVIVLKRAVEGGTFRALGMKPSGLMALYFTEILLLLLSGTAVGFAASLVIVKAASAYNLSFISGFDLFLTGGRLAPSLYAGEAAVLVGIIFVTTLGAVLFTLRKLVHISPVGALATVS